MVENPGGQGKEGPSSHWRAARRQGDPSVKRCEIDRAGPRPRGGAVVAELSSPYKVEAAAAGEAGSRGSP